MRASGGGDNMTQAMCSLDGLWEGAPHAARVFDPLDVAPLPALARSYLTHAIAAGTPLASAVRLRMHGMIRLKRWRKFRAVEVITNDGAMIWRAAVRVAGTSIRGYDSIVGGHGAMRWRLFGLLPVIREAGDDISRSVANRVAVESIWLPSMLVGDRTRWRAIDATTAEASVSIAGHAADLRMTVDHGRLTSIGLLRWGNPDGGPFRENPFGAYVDQEATFDGYTIPARLRVGWHFDDAARFDAEGKFFEVSIDAASYR